MPRQACGHVLTRRGHHLIGKGHDLTRGGLEAALWGAMDLRGSFVPQKVIENGTNTSGGGRDQEAWTGGKVSGAK